MNNPMDSKPRPALLLVDDDKTFCEALGPALTRRGFGVRTAHNPKDALNLAEQHRPAYALVDVLLSGDSGIDLIQPLLNLVPPMRIVVLTGFASIATAVQAIKLGAVHYLSKPADVAEILAAFHRDHGGHARPRPAADGRSGMGAYPAGPHPLRGEYLGGLPALGHPSPHPATQIETGAELALKIQGGLSRSLTVTAHKAGWCRHCRSANPRLARKLPQP
jgi:ActR/RegA family two-component response regulator